MNQQLLALITFAAIAAINLAAGAADDSDQLAFPQLTLQPIDQAIHVGSNAVFTAQATNGWLSVYALIKVMRDAKATGITRATVKAAFDSAKDIPMFDLVPPWTPSKQAANAIFKGISNSMYWTGHWDAAKKDFVVDDKPVDILALLG